MSVLSRYYRNFIPFCKRLVCEPSSFSLKNQRLNCSSQATYSKSTIDEISTQLTKMANNISNDDDICGELDAMLSTLGLDGRYFIVDVGANLTNKKYARDLDQVIQRAKDSG